MKKTIIDLGCGIGGALMPFTKKYDVVGVDIDPTNIEICNKKIPQGNWIVGDVAKIDLSQFKNIEIIICTEVIEHIDDWKKAIKNISNVRAGTKLFLSVPHTQSEKKLMDLRNKYWQEIGHKHFFDGSEIKKELEKYGWNNIKIKRTNAALYFELKALFKKNAPCIRNTYYENTLSLPVKLFFQLFRPNLFQTRLKYIPLWLITLPLAKILNIFWGATIEIEAIK